VTSDPAALFQSLLYEAAGRTINPVHGAVGLLGTGNWHLCQAAVDTARVGGVLRPRAVPEPRVPAGARGAEGAPPAAGHAVHELGRVRDLRRRQGAGAAQPLPLRRSACGQLILIPAFPSCPPYVCSQDGGRSRRPSI